MKFHVTPTRTIDSSGGPPSLDDQILIFEEQVRGWQLDIADQIAKNVQHSGFAVLAITMSYPEKIWQFINGRPSRGTSEKAFREGMCSIFNSLDPNNQDHRAAIDLIYSSVRCGMYHYGGTARGVTLSAEYPTSFAVDGNQVRINPHKIPGEFKRHLATYVNELRKAENLDLRNKFQQMFGNA